MRRWSARIWNLPLLLASTLVRRAFHRDLERRTGSPSPRPLAVLDALRHPEFRAVLYLRLRASGTAGLVLQRLLRTTWSQPAAFEVACDSIGPGLHVMHGFATIVNARSIGRDCMVSQQVTVGESADGKPTIGDRVSILPGVIVVGNSTVGDDVVIGPGAVVIKDVPAGVTVAGVPARILGPSPPRATER